MIAPSFITTYSVALLILYIIHVKCQLYVSSGCNNVPGVGDASQILNNEMFPLAVAMAANAYDQIDDAINFPDSMTEDNRKRILKVLRSFTYPSLRTSKFRDDVLPGLLSM